MTIVRNPSPSVRVGKADLGPVCSPVPEAQLLSNECDGPWPQPWMWGSQCAAPRASPHMKVPPYSGADTILPVVGASTISFSVAAAGSSSAAAAQRPVAQCETEQYGQARSSSHCRRRRNCAPRPLESATPICGVVVGGKTAEVERTSPTRPAVPVDAPTPQCRGLFRADRPGHAQTQPGAG